MITRGYVRLCITGFNQMRLLNELVGNAIKCSDVKKKNSSEMSLTVMKSQAEKTFAILEKMCYNYTVTERKDFMTLLSVAAVRAGIVLGLVIFSAVLTVFYGLIWRIEITGNEKVDSLTIERTLKTAGIAIGKTTKGIDKNEVRNLINSIDGVLESSVELSGSTVRINVLEVTDYVKPQEDAFADIVSLFDGRVTKIITTSGTATVRVGDIVKCGRVLIGAYRTDAEGNKIPVAAKGEAYGETAFTKSVEFSTVTYEYVRTGKTYIDTRYTIFGIKNQKLRSPGFASFEAESSESFIFDGFLLPLKMHRTVYYETVLTETVYDVDERTGYYKNMLIFENVIKAGGSETSSTHHLENIGVNRYRLSVYIVANVKLT